MSPRGLDSHAPDPGRVLDVLFVDNHLLVVSKPAGLPSVPDSSGDESALDLARSWVEREFQKPGRAYLGVVHRLDRPVSGVLVFARTSKAAARLTNAFREGSVRKVYWGLVCGRVRGEGGEIEQWLRKDRARNRVTVVGPGISGAKLARTVWRVLRRGDERTLLELSPQTGRPHQLRVAMARGIGVPLCGDLKYGAREGLAGMRIALHAREVAFAHPVGGEEVRVRCEVSGELWG